MNYERFKKQMDFILEIDKAKNIFRQTFISSNDRTENDAEHSWHMCVMAFLMAEYFDSDIDIAKVVKMLLIHDIVEIDAGDTYCYDAKANEDKAEREMKSATRIFGLLPEDQFNEYMELWQEFEKKETKEAVFAAVLDRVQPIMLNYATDGRAWIEHGIHHEQVLERNKITLEKAPEEFVMYLKEIIDSAVEKGYLK